ncbi:uncharacterized protein LOC111004819 isoform X2 [Momordica charantia]|uniref:Uncharacterized protein LOC111004819 isoform X2 n=1 Tax=Momordica charantia TaxID=3673 RepID=A0A6J1BRT7_MOMCH|nr:uncharacterized protein LOC111004819 isoform X2 [Momordica charantia]
MICDDGGEAFCSVLVPMAISMALTKINLLRFPPSSSSRSSFKPARCSSLQQVQLQADSTIACEPCNGEGWIVCDFCKGQKTNVKAENNRIYRRCPSCRAVGYVLCSKCKVFKCVTFPNFSDGRH